MVSLLADHALHKLLLEVLDEWTRVLDDGGTIDAVYMDFMKAFDTVPHHRLICKLEAYGVQGKLLAWIRAFLLGRRQRVVVGGQHVSGLMFLVEYRRDLSLAPPCF